MVGITWMDDKQRRRVSRSHRRPSCRMRASTNHVYSHDIRKAHHPRLQLTHHQPIERALQSALGQNVSHVLGGTAAHPELCII